MSIQEEVKEIIKNDGKVLVMCKLGLIEFTNPEKASDFIMSLPEGSSVELI